MESMWNCGSVSSTPFRPTPFVGLLCLYDVTLDDGIMCHLEIIKGVCHELLDSWLSLVGETNSTDECG